jgi:hypothetical protein
MVSVTDSMKCIYCLQDKSKSSFQKREHVIPQFFGRFTPDNLILRELVCDECNQFFGDKIELFWGRDSLESILRLKHGLRPKDSLKNRKRVRSKIHEGDFKGAIVREKLDEFGKIGAELSIQAGFFHKDRKEYDYFEIGNIPFSDELVERGYEIKNCTILLIGYNEEIKLLEKELNEKGIPIKGDSKLLKKPEPSGMIQIESEATLDRVIMRGICKIAFNYLAYHTSNRFVLKNIFNGIRNYIRYDNGDSEVYLSVNQPPILHADRRLEKIGKKVTEGHLIVLGWKNGRTIISKLSFFNAHTYGITLCNDYDGLWIPFKSGHHFDIRTKEVSKLFAISNALIP